MADGGFDDEDWDADFVAQIVQAEVRALSASSQFPPPPPPSPPPSPQAPSLIPLPSRPPPSKPPPPCTWIPPPPDVSYSPPRELSQRPQSHHTGDIPESFAPRIDIAKETEVSRLQKELNCVSEQLSHLEKECSELRKERETNLEQLRILNSRIEAKDADVNPRKNMEMDGRLAPWISATCQNAKPSNKQLGFWTKSCNMGRDVPTEVSTSTSRETCCRSEKLLGLWNSNDQEQGRVLVADMYKMSEADFHVLFPCLNSLGNGSGKAPTDKQFPQSQEFAKVLHLYTVFTQISNHILGLEDLLKALVDLCNSKNVSIVHWAVRVLHKIFSNFSIMEKEFGERENVTVEEPISGNNEHDTNGCGNTEKESLSFSNVAEILKQGPPPSVISLSDAKTQRINGFSNHNFATSVSGVYLVSLFEHMCVISTKIDDKWIRCEALSVMILILMRHNAYLERDKFAGELVFQTLSKLLKREAGFWVQDRAVHALYLLCNCPKVIAMISSCLKDGELACSKDMNADSSSFQWLNDILMGLADCVAYYGTATAEEMNLRRNAVIFLAFLGASGRSGFEILLNHKLAEGTNFLAIILQSMVSDLDLEASKSAKRSREQSLLMREVLILLNRLVSHPQYSVPVLEMLTSTRVMVSMTVDVANRLTQKSKLAWQVDNSKQIRESEILDLAHVFKKRVFAFLGDNIS